MPLTTLLRRTIPGPRHFLPAMLAASAVLAACSSNDNTTTLTASAVGVISGNAQTAAAGGTLALPLVVKVTDQNGAAMSGVTVNFTASGGASLRSATATTDASGQATDSVTIIGNVAGADTVTASVSGVTTSAIFTYTATAGAAAAVTVVSGNNQSATAGTALAASMVVKVTDQFGNPVSGATVDWTTTGGLLTSAQTTTDATGQTSAGLTLPALPGAATVTATLDGTATATTFTETAM